MRYQTWENTVSASMAMPLYKEISYTVGIQIFVLKSQFSGLKKNADGGVLYTSQFTKPKSGLSHENALQAARCSRNNEAI